MRYKTEIEVGWVLGPWIRIGRYEVGSGILNSTPMQAILYSDEDDADDKRAVILEGETERARGWEYFGRQQMNNGGLAWTVAFNGRTLYFTKDPS